MKNKKRELIKIKNKIIEYFSNNILFFSYVIISVSVGILLSIMSFNSIKLTAILGDLLIAIIIATLGCLLKPEHRFNYYLIWLIFKSCLCIGNTIYYQFYHSFLSVNLLSTASMLGTVSDSLFDKLHYYQFVYIIFPLIFIYIQKKLIKKSYYKKIVNINSFKTNLFVTLGVLILLLCFTLNETNISRIRKQWNREYIVSEFGIDIYTINDLIQSIKPKINTLFDYEESSEEFVNFYSCKLEEKKESNEYTNIFKGKNVLFIHAESIQNFLINLEINGEEVTPNLNKFASEGMYFTKYYPQISVGTSSDTEFTVNTGLMPSSSGTVFVNYFDRTYYGMPYYFSKMGYYTFSTHANNADYWNRKIMHKNLGYNDFYAKDSYEVPEESDSEYIGLGLSDKSFFKQFIPILRNIKNEHTNYMGTIITLTNHSPFNDVTKYGEFDVTMKYEKDGEEKTANYLEGTSMGNYLKSSHYADEAFGQLINDLKENKLLDNTVIVLYGDHESRLAKKEFDLLYNYNPETNSIDTNKEDYYEIDSYSYDLLKNTPLIIWSNDKKFNKEINDVMGAYDVLPTMANMFGFTENYSLGHDIFSDNEKIVVFPNGNVLTNNVYYSSVKDEYITFNSEPIESDYIERLKKYANKILDVSNGIVTHDLIKNSSSLIGECKSEEEEEK